MQKHVLSLAAALLVTGLLAGFSQPRVGQAGERVGYAITDLGTLGGPEATPLDINDRGQVVGSSRTPSSSLPHAFVWQDGVMTDLGVGEAGDGSAATAINDAGQIAGTLMSPDARRSLHTHAAVWEAGQATSLGELDAMQSLGLGINDAGQVIGTAYPGGATRGFMADLDSGEVVLLDGPTGESASARAIDDRGDIAGVVEWQAPAGLSTRAVIWRNGEAGYLPMPDGYRGSFASAMSNADLVIGTVITATSQRRAAIWQSGMLDLLPGLSGGPAQAHDVNDRGQVVGYATTENGERHAVLWERGEALDLNSLLPDGSELTLSEARAINGNGQIVATAQTQGSNFPRAILLSPVSVDQTPPALDLPGELTVNATSPHGAVVTYPAAAVDDVDPDPALTCAPPSGASFPIGTTDVVCVASDASGNTSSGRFAVTVLGASDQIEGLVDLIGSLDLQSGVGNSLIAKLESARKTLANGDPDSAACGKLRAFENHAGAQAGNHLTAEQANQLIEGSAQIRAVLGCA